MTELRDYANCLICAYFERLNDTRGQCRRNAPAATVSVGLLPEDAHAYWPLVDVADWCGEWESSEQRRENHGETD